MDSTLHRDSALLPFSSHPETFLCQYRWGPSAEAQDLEVRSRERTRVRCVETIWRGQVVETEGMIWRSLGLPERQFIIILEKAHKETSRTTISAFFPVSTPRQQGTTYGALGAGVITVAILGSRGRHWLPLSDLWVDAMSCPHCPRRVHSLCH